MDVFEYAMQMELDGEKYYRELAGQSPIKGLIAILTMLAEDEVKHYNAIKEAQTTQPQMAETTALDASQNIFAQMKDSGLEIAPADDQIELYQKACEIERKSEEFYREKAQEVENEYHKGLFLRLAEEEKKHCFLLKNIIEFISQPKTWLENAEFCHLQEY